MSNLCESVHVSLPEPTHAVVFVLACKVADEFVVAVVEFVTVRGEEKARHAM
jgi:hypothetical protein